MTILVTVKRGLLAEGASLMAATILQACKTFLSSEKLNLFFSFTFTEFPFSPRPTLMDTEHFSAKLKHSPEFHLSMIKCLFVGQLPRLTLNGN